MRTVTYRFNVDAGHRVQGPAHPCHSPHGHSYDFDVELRATGPLAAQSIAAASLGICTWLKHTFHLAFVVERGDPLAAWLLENSMRWVELDGPPTIDTLTEVVFKNAQQIAEPLGAEVVRARGHEAPNVWADYPPPMPETMTVRIDSTLTAEAPLAAPPPPSPAGEEGA